MQLYFMGQLPPALAGGKKIITEKALAKIIFIWLKPINKAQFSAPAKAGGNSSQNKVRC